MKTDKGKLLYLSPDNLSFHPKNLRRFYPEDQVREMADSILAKGVYQAMLVIRNGLDGKYIVVDGNMRLAGASVSKTESRYINRIKQKVKVFERRRSERTG